ncbi:hypothetical protein [Chitinolyticbacter albus]|uniref:hypothetical protein n=1 Tax=Chitinolyticbacter albus TaxID=2961951 RepID=UPI00210E0B3F|nr:hypothetical protein [Chitinolyticbacter albus]
MWSKVTAGAVLGLPLSAFAVGTVIYAWPGPWQHSMVVGLVFFFPLWMAVIAASPLFRSAGRAWLWLALASAAAFAALWLIKFTGFGS